MKRTLLLAVCALSAQTALAQEAATFTSSGTWTVPAGVSVIHVEVIGAGGNGAINGSGGGGGGGYASGDFTVTPGAAYTITVGTAGSTTATSVMPLGIQATPGVSSVYSSAALGGAGGTGSGGTINRTGGNGGNGTYTYFGGGGGGAAGPDANGTNGSSTPPWAGVCLYPGGAGGAGGGGMAGDGGKGAGFTDVSCSGADPATAGGNYGGGGAGGNGNSSPPSNGADGFVRITWCGDVAAPTGAAVQTFCRADSATIADLEVTGDSVRWYATDTGTMELPGSTMLANGTYYASQAVSGCVSGTRLEVTVQVDTVNTEVSVTGNTLTAAETGATYQWIDCFDNQPVGGATSGAYLATTNGSYAVVVTKNGCTDTSECFVITGVGVAEVAGSGPMRLFPNPANDQLTLETNGNLYGKNYVITDVLGKKVASGIIRGAKTVIPVRQLPKGIYHLQAAGARLRFVK